MIIGNSFTTIEFARMLLEHVGRVVWIDHQHCRFDRKVIDRFHPDEVWWMPNERFLICDPGAELVGSPGEHGAQGDARRAPQPARARRRALGKKRLCAEPCGGPWSRAALSRDRGGGR